MRLLNLHPWKVSPSQAIEIQKKLIKRISLKDCLKTIQKVAAGDAEFSQGRAYGVVCVFSFPELKLLEVIKKSLPSNFPYIPGLLAFREGPVLIKCFEALKEEPDLIIFDGQGIAHPRKMGLATHLGILLNKPTIGCAKNWLFGSYEQKLGKDKANRILLRDKKREIIGAVLRTRFNVKPVFVSPGYKISLKKSIEIILVCCQRYRIPEPLRKVHLFLA